MNNEKTAEATSQIVPSTTSANQLAQTTEKLLPCPYCPRMFNDYRRRMGHVRSMHPDMPIPRRTPEEMYAHKRLEQQRIRKANLERGLTTRGTPRKIALRKSPMGSVNLSKMSNRERYEYYKERYRRKGLNAKGQPFKVTKKAAENIAHAQKMRRQRERREKERLLNGAQPQREEQPQDNLGDSARAIIMAAQVLRSVSIGMKL